ncbi:hypothetical protein PIB30_093241 [Stylosanthes scabra]|uniref:RNase H type-1 domain-containing protein n=1 Tax=Stylosanthes scabra TaxID=79078 RepID=A0ABU6ZTT9_9FABA|nr:hypothetical protein [Stylosanthes scabra]
MWWIWRSRCQEVFHPDDPWSDVMIAGHSRSLFNDIISASKVWNGLMLAWEAGDKNVICETDSLENLLRRDWFVKFELINREANSVADWMAKRGAHCHSDYCLWASPNEVLEVFLRQKAFIPS